MTKEKCIVCDEVEAVYIEGVDEEYNPITEQTEDYPYRGLECKKCLHFEHREYEDGEGGVSDDDLIQD